MRRAGTCAGKEWHVRAMPWWSAVRTISA